jgi:hypothetical protein
VVGGEDLSNHELSVEVDLFCGRSLVSPSLLDVPEEPSIGLASGASFAVVKEALERRRRLRSLRKLGMVGETRSEQAQDAGCSGAMTRARSKTARTTCV